MEMRAKKALVVNCSAPHYNLGAAKIADWLRGQGYIVETTGVEFDFEAKTFLPDWLRSRGLGRVTKPVDKKKIHCDYDLVCLSLIFPWDAPLARKIARLVKANSEVWCGGPGIWALERDWKKWTGLDCQVGVDERFEHQQGNYLHTFASRGCPTGCWWCGVPTFEGKEFTLEFEFQLAPVLCDNNLSRLPPLYQKYIIARYQKANYPLFDANSGFEPAYFDEDTYQRWKPLIHSRTQIDGRKGPWRFAFDHIGERDDVVRMLRILKEEASAQKRVYVLCGNETLESCYERTQIVIAEGGEPHCQYVQPLNYLRDKKLWEKNGWTNQQAIDFCRYFNLKVKLWRKTPIWEYRPRKDRVAPFEFMRPATIAA